MHYLILQFHGKIRPVTTSDCATVVNKHNTAVLLSSLIESMLGCLETKKEVTCALLSHTLLLLPHNAGRNVQPVHRTILKLHDSGLYCWMQNKTVHFYWISGHQLERKKARAQMIWFVSSHFIISFQFINHRTKFSLCTQKTRQKLQWKIVVSTPAVKRIQTDIYRNTAECAKRPCVEKRPTRTIHIIRT